MWRFVVATALLFVLVVLVADMLFDGSRSLGTVDRHPPPPAWPSAERRAPLADGSVVPDADRTASADAPVYGPPSAIPAAERDLGQTEVIRANAAEAPQTGWPNARDDQPWSGQSLLSPPAEDVPYPEVKPPDGLTQPATTSAERATPAQVRKAQQQLAMLGYDPGPVDGRSGVRTRAAVREFQRSLRQPATGEIDGSLLSQLEAEVRAWTHLRQQELDAMSSGPTPEKHRPSRGVFGSILGGMQRLMGRNFDSIRHPDDIRAYCHRNTDSWIYDFGREAFLYCGNVLAGQMATVSTEATDNR